MIFSIVSYAFQVSLDSSARSVVYEVADLSRSDRVVYTSTIEKDLILTSTKELIITVPEPPTVPLASPNGTKSKSLLLTGSLLVDVLTSRQVSIPVFITYILHVASQSVVEKLFIHQLLTSP